MAAITYPMGKCNSREGGFRLKGFSTIFIILVLLFLGLLFLGSKLTTVAGYGPLFLAEDYQEVDPSQYPLPGMPKLPCKIFQALTGKPCTWLMEVGKSGEKQIFRLRLMSGRWVIIEIEGMRCLLSELESGLPTSYASTQWGWVSYIRVVEWARGLGLGRFGWVAFDRVARQISTGLGEQAVHVFADASEMNWGTTLLQGIPFINQITERLWIYLIPEH